MGSQLLKVITPDFQATWTIKEIEDQLNGFKVNGPGWYFKDGTSMLVVATDMQDVYTILVYFDRDPRESFAAMVGAPVQLAKNGKQDTSNSLAGLIVLLLGMVVLVPLAGFITHKFGFMGLILMAIGTLVCWRMLKYTAEN